MTVGMGPAFWKVHPAAAAGTLLSLTHFDSEADGTLLPHDEVAARTWFTNADPGEVYVSTSLSKFGGGSLRREYGTDANHVYTDISGLSADDCTAEGWVRISTSGNNSRFVNIYEIGSPNGITLGWWSGDGKLRIETDFSSSIVTSTILSANTWYHYAICCQGDYTWVWIDGVEAYSTASRLMPSGNIRYALNSCPQGNGANHGGNVDECRLYWDIALYTAAFSPPTAPFPNP